jgi:hypothetical protein
LIRLVVLFALLLSACASASVEPTPTATQASLTGTVNILTPQANTPIYDELLTVSGTADVTAFKLRLVGAGNQVLTQIMVEPADDSWCVEIPHNYNGEPTPVRVVAASVDDMGEYAAVEITLAGFEHRPTDLPSHQPC